MKNRVMLSCKLYSRSSKCEIQETNISTIELSIFRPKESGFNDVFLGYERGKQIVES